MSELTDAMSDSMSRILGLYSDTVTYSRSGESDLSVSAITARPLMTSGGEDVSLIADFTDFTIAVSDITYGVPERGDTITLTRGGVSHVYEVINAGGTGYYEFEDEAETAYLIHTKRKT